ncbi:MAG: hypothetical protein KC636_31055 [Myxococcales bacterium]|nr:hypothetical protein [Myxococcales bacterium]
MARPPDTSWKVLPSDPPVQLADNLWRVEGDIEGMSIRRCMVVARLRAGGLVLHNAIALDDAGMAWLEGLGAPQVMVVPNGFHRLDAPRYRARYPALRVVCPAGSRKKVAERVDVDDDYRGCPRPDPDDDSVELRHLEGVKGVEGVMTVRSSDGVTLVFNDAVFNLQHGRGLFMFVYGRLMGNAGGPKVTSITRWLLVKDKRAFRADLEALAATPGLTRIIVAHGDVIDDDAAGVLRSVAATL